jgi:hypothetical protein
MERQSGRVWAVKCYLSPEDQMNIARLFWVLYWAWVVSEAKSKDFTCREMEFELKGLMRRELLRMWACAWHCGTESDITGWSGLGR